MIGILDYGMGNLGSVSNACAFLNLPARVVTSPDETASCRALILPGVGAFGDCMAHLRARGLDGAVRQWIEADQPFLGICLGLQVLYEGSEESPDIPGLGFFPGYARKFALAPEWKVPQIGWNRVRWRRADCPLFDGIPDGSYFYFVHSFYVPMNERSEEAATTFYGVDYISAIWRGHLAAVQFHPEKSQSWGLQLLRNFGRWVSQVES